MPSPAVAPLTHKDLVAIGEWWLSKTCGYGAVLTELGGDSVFGEMPDVFGVRKSTSTVIECKVSRADFLADRKKLFRMQPHKGMGMLRFYLCPKGLLTPKDVEGTGWGLMETVGKKVKVLVPSHQFERSLKAEHRLMYTALQRVGFRIGCRLSQITAWDTRYQQVPVCEVSEIPDEKFVGL